MKILSLLNQKRFSRGNSVFYIVVVILVIIALGMGAAIYFHQKNNQSEQDTAAQTEELTGFKDLATDTQIGQNLDNLSEKIQLLSNTQKNVDAAANDQPTAMNSARNSELKNQAKVEINRQVNAFPKLIDAIANLKSATEEQKTAFNNQIETDIKELGDLKAQIEIDSSITATKVDVQALSGKYKVFAVLSAKIYTMAELEAAADLNTSFDMLSAQLLTRINQLKSAGQDTTDLDKISSEFQTKLQNAKDKTKIANDLIFGLSVENYPANKGVIQSVQQSAADLNNSLQGAYTDAKNMFSLIQTKTSVSPSATPIASLSPLPGGGN